MAPGISFELSADKARVASPISLFALPPKPEALLTRSVDAEHPASIVARAANETADPKLSGLDIELPLAFGLFGHGLEFRHGREQMIERIRHDLLRRATVDG